MLSESGWKKTRYHLSLIPWFLLNIISAPYRPTQIPFLPKNNFWIFWYQGVKIDPRVCRVLPENIMKLICKVLERKNISRWKHIHIYFKKKLALVCFGWLRKTWCSSRFGLRKSFVPCLVSRVICQTLKAYLQTCCTGFGLAKVSDDAASDFEEQILCSLPHVKSHQLNFEVIAMGLVWL